MRVEPVELPPVWGLAPGKTCGKPDVRSHPEAPGHDSTHRRGLTIQNERSPNDSGVSPELALPDLFAQHGEGWDSWPAVCGGKRPADERRHAEAAKEVTGHP